MLGESWEVRSDSYCLGGFHDHITRCPRLIFLAQFRQRRPYQHPAVVGVLAPVCVTLNTPQAGSLWLPLGVAVIL